VDQQLPDAERGIREHLAAAHALTARIGEVRGEGTDDDDLVRAAVTAGGKVLDLTLDPRVMRLASQDLADRTRAALEAARVDAERQVNAAMADAFRTNSSWEELVSGEVPVDMAAALPPLPEPDAFDELIRLARRDAPPD
jgi:hypothetical protein